MQEGQITQATNTNAKISFEQAIEDIQMNKEVKHKAAKDNRFNTQGSMMAVNSGLLGGCKNGLFNGSCKVHIHIILMVLFISTQDSCTIDITKCWWLGC